MPSFIDTMTGKTTRRKTEDAEQRAVNGKKPAAKKPAPKKKGERTQSALRRDVNETFWGNNK